MICDGEEVCLDIFGIEIKVAMKKLLDVNLTNSDFAECGKPTPGLMNSLRAFKQN